MESEIQNKIGEIKVSINDFKNSLNKLHYYHFTDQLRHDNSNTVKFPAVDSYPYSADSNSEFLKIELDGHYQIIFTDIILGGNDGQFIIHDDINGNDLIVNEINGTSSWTPLTIDAVIPITIDNGFGYTRIKLYVNKKK